MINLLAPHVKDELRAARRNVVLRRYLILTTLTALSIVGAFEVGMYITSQEKTLADQERATQIERKKVYATTEKQAAQYTKDLATAKVIINKQTSASKFITDIAATLPKSVVLSQVNLSTAPTAAAVGTVLEARSKAYSDALVLKKNLEDSSLFEGVNIASIRMTDITESSTTIERTYPVEIIINLKRSAGSTQ